MRFEELTIWKDLKEDQKNSLRNLRKKTYLTGFWISLKTLFLFMSSSILLSLINYFYIKNTVFAMFTGVLTGIMISISMGKQFEALIENTNKEIKNIISN